MIEFTQYVGRVQGWRGQLTGLPQWARTIVGIFAIPGIVLAALSLLALLISILALLLLTVPVYTLLRRLTTPATSNPVDEIGSPGVKRVESSIVE
jgi:hypothetical protein